MKIKDLSEKKLVYTTNSIIKKTDSIVHFSLDEDGDLQALGNEEQDVNNAAIISLSQILKIDETIYKIDNIEIGDAYTRENKESNWELSK